MDALSVSPLGAATLSPLRPVSALPLLAPDENPSASTLSAGDLAQTILQRTLQAAALFPVVEPTMGSLGLAQEATASLLAALGSPQAAVPATPAPHATAAPLPTAFNATTATPAGGTTLPATVPRDLPAGQDAFTNGSSLEFALQTALRFGAGVAAQATPALQALNPGSDLVRDATAVLRTGNLQPHAGAPGPESFTHPQAPPPRALHTYQGLPVPGEPRLLDLLA